MKAIAADKESILGYTFNLCQGARNISSRDFRLAVIDVLVKLYGTLADPDYTNVCFALQYLDRPLEVSQTLYRLCRGSDESALQAASWQLELARGQRRLSRLGACARLAAPARTGIGLLGRRVQSRLQHQRAAAAEAHGGERQLIVLHLPRQEGGRVHLLPRQGRRVLERWR